MKLHLVWFKRDLRCEDHAPLSEAWQAAKRDGGAVVGCYAVESGYWQGQDTSVRQWHFVRECLSDLDQALQAISADSEQSGDRLWLVTRPFEEWLEALAQQHSLTLYSHEETGNDWTFQRDRRVALCCRNLSIVWQQYTQHGVRRPNPDRDDWTRWRQQWLQQPLSPTPVRLPLLPTPVSACPASTSAKLPNTITRSLIAVADLYGAEQNNLGYDQTPCPGRQRGGLLAAQRWSESFFRQRGEWYQGSISAPLSAEQHCSRLSPYLALGCLSVRQLQHQIEHARSQHDSSRWHASLGAFESRLWWHCHFIQKLEDEPSQQWQSLHPAYRDIRTVDESLLAAWQQGQTGWPLADACMRYLQHHGWVNFRMRAMLMSLACYPLWLPWQSPAQRLAQLFVDYEPGIHYPQAQMQAGATGINMLRMYNPTQQALKVDPDGRFIRRWLPELAPLPNSYIHQPWLFPRSRQQQLGVVIERDYPAPVVDFDQATRLARQKLKAVRQTADFRQFAEQIGQRHGSRQRSAQSSSGRPRKSSAEQHGQLSLW